MKLAFKIELEVNMIDKNKVCIHCENGICKLYKHEKVECTYENGIKKENERMCCSGYEPKNKS